MRVLHNIILSILIILYHLFYNPPKLKKWIELETYKDRIIRSSEDGNFPVYLLQYLSIALGVPSTMFDQADWVKLVSTFYLSISKSPKVQLPITSPTDEKSKEESWHYDGRMWHLYSHMLAKSYGWSLEYISQLHVEEALAKIQEIEVDEQLEHEFFYGLSEAAYSYDKHTKQSKFVPLPRPHWMRTKIQPIKKFLIPKDMMPVGVVNGMEALPDEYRPKEISSN